MQRFSYKLKVFIKAVERIAKEKKFIVSVVNKDSGVRFELFRKNEDIPFTFWVVHGEHDKAKKVTSRKDYKKAANELMIDLDYFESVLEGKK
jgi:hypothetical protein